MKNYFYLPCHLNHNSKRENLYSERKYFVLGVDLFSVGLGVQESRQGTTKVSVRANLPERVSRGPLSFFPLRLLQ